MSPAHTETILAVDDEPINLSILGQQLKDHYRVRAATSGARALELAAAQPPDLILLDIMMPGMDGYTVLERLRADEKLRDIPVIMATGVDEFESVIRCMQLGAEDYLQKPFDETVLRRRVNASLERKRLRDENARHLKQIEDELEAAQKIQLSMVPDDFRAPTPECPVEVFARLLPARKIGGDLYDFFWDEAGRFHFVVADVSGKGAPAALFMARIKTMTRLVATLYRAPGGGLPEPGQVIARINGDLSADNRQDMFVTVFFGVLDPRTGTLKYCNAGHQSPYVISGHGELTAIDGPRGLPLGIIGDYAYETGTHQLARGDSIFVYTDGVTEAMDEGNKLFTDVRLKEVLKTLARASATEVVDKVIASVRKFAVGVDQADDIAVIAIRLIDIR